jgi:hypothetical protein
MPRTKARVEGVEVARIVGSAMRPNDFFADFTPVAQDARLKRVQEAFAEGMGMDELNNATPIELIERRGEYFVGNDGNRRVSVAKQNKVRTLRCEVTRILEK